MSAENVALVRSLHLDPSSDVAELISDDAATATLREAIGRAFDPDVECTMGFPGGMRVAYSGRGLDGLQSAWQDWLRQWVSFRTEVEDILDGGDRVVVLHRIEGRRRDDAPVETLRRATVWTVRDGLIVHVDFNLAPDDALATVELATD